MSTFYLAVCFTIGFIFADGVTTIDPNVEEDPRTSYLIRRAIDGTRGSKYYEREYDDSFDIYDPLEDDTDFSGFRSNVPGEPGIDYPSFTRIPQTSFTCERQFRGYYADEEAGCQLFHVCDGNFLVSSFLCPIGSTFSQKLLTCDWWNKVDCSTTKDFYESNEASLITEVDDDEILRKAWEMTSLQSQRNGVTIDPNDKNHNDINQRNTRINDLTVDNDNKKSDNYHRFKYSSRYSSALDQHDRDIDYYPAPPEEISSSIRVHTVGDDEHNDRHHDLQPAYAPTVPTITTTTRRYYSPTIPSIIRPTTKSKYDLEFESSDHLYSARGKSLVTRTTEKSVHSTTVDTVTPATIEVSSITEEIPTSNSIPSRLLQAPDVVQQMATDKLQLVTEYSTIEFHTSNDTDKEEKIVRNNTVYNDTIKTIPSVVFLPPFFYYSTVGQHDAVGDRESLIVNLTANERHDNSTIIPINYEYELIPEDQITTIESKVELTTSASEEFDHSVEVNSTETADDVIEGESSPFQITVTVNKDEEFQHPSGELLRSLIAQQDPTSSDVIGDIEIVKSNEADGLAATEHNTRTVNNVNQQKRERSHSRVINYGSHDRVRSKSSDIVPRPFSLDAPVNYEVVTLSGVDDNNSRPLTESTTNLPMKNSRTNSGRLRTGKIRSDDIQTVQNQTTNDGDAEGREILQELAQTFGRQSHKSDKTTFNLPNRQRSFNFKTDEPIRVPEEPKTNEERAKKIDNDDNKDEKFVVETELVPSLGFSLNTDEELEEYMTAVLRGLFKDIPVPTISNTATEEPVAEDSHS